MEVGLGEDGESEKLFHLVFEPSYRGEPLHQFADSSHKIPKGNRISLMSSENATKVN